MNSTLPPLPVPTNESAAFWEACRRHELIIQRCANCGTYRHYPRAACHSCASMDVEWVRASGRGIVYTFTLCHQAFHPHFKTRVPYNVVVVELDDIPGIRMASTVVDCSNEDIRIGMPVEIVWEDVTEDVTLYNFRLVKE